MLEYNSWLQYKEYSFHGSKDKSSSDWIPCWFKHHRNHAFIRGVLQVTAADTLSHGIDAAISGIAGIRHLVLGVSLILILLAIKKNCEE